MNTFSCAAPWRGLHINIRGDVKTCCAGDPDMLGNINNNNIEEILNGAKLKEIRQAFKEGQTHSYCINCTDRESKGATSERDWHNNINEDFDLEKAGLDYEYPTLIDARWNSTCNLSCNYCGPADSSRWAVLKHIPISNNTRQYYTEVCDFIEQNYEHVKEVALVGGEPFLLPENDRLLDVIPADAVVTVITNLSIPLENNRIFQKLAQRRRVGWSISFENIGDRFNYVRYGADWQLHLHNLDIVQGLMKTSGHWGGAHAVYNLFNATRLYEFKEFMSARGLTIKWQNLHTPPELDPRLYGVEVASLAIAEIERVFAGCSVDSEERELFTQALNTYQEKLTPNTQMLEQLKGFITTIETKYHPATAGEFARLWPELGELIRG